MQSCGQTGVPNEINNTKTADLKRITGTKLFVPENKDFRAIPKSPVYQKSAGTFLSVSEFAGSGYREANVASAQRDPATKLYKKIRYNGYDGVYIEGAVRGKTMIELYFGDSSFEGMIKAECPKTDNSARDEIINIIKQSYYDKAFPLDLSELVNYKLDEKITGFHFTKTDPDYGEKYEPANPDEYDNFFTVKSLPILPSYEKEKEILNRENENDSYIEVLNTKESTINGYHAYTRNMKRKELRIYEVLLMDEHAGVLFTGQCDGNKYIKQYMETIPTIRLVNN